MITAQDVNKLRNMTGLGMMDCKKALTESNGDFEKAIEILRKKGQKLSQARSGKEAKEGSVFIELDGNNQSATVVALNCETDFVAKNSEFQKLGQTIASVAFNNTVSDKEELMNILHEGQSIRDHITELIGKIGEKIDISSLTHLTGEVVVPYIHMGHKLGVLVALEGAHGTDVKQAGKDIGMQIAAMNPLAIDESKIDKSIIEKELEIAKAQMRAEKKPEDRIESIAKGKLNKFFKENTLLQQAFVKDSSMSVAQYLKTISKELTVSSFVRIVIN